MSTRFERLRKETPWDLSINREAGAGDGNGNGTTPAKSAGRKRTPKGSAKAKKAKNSGGSDDEEDDDEYDGTPSKKAKGPLNKVRSGRVTKAKGVKGYSEMGDEDDDDHDAMIKGEHGATTESNDYGHGKPFMSFSTIRLAY